MQSVAFGSRGRGPAGVGCFLLWLLLPPSPDGGPFGNCGSSQLLQMAVRLEIVPAAVRQIYVNFFTCLYVGC